MKGQNQKKYSEKQPPDKKNKIKYVEKEKVETQPTGKQTVQKEEKAYTENRYYKKQGTKPKKEYVQRPDMLAKKSSVQPTLNCLICSQGIQKRNSIWTCKECCISLHLRCIKQWIKKSNPEREGHRNLLFNWYCIQCKTQYNEPMPEYYCFCGKFKDPEYDRDLQPHSCGQFCQRKRGANCPHLCPDLCHSGKCKPCEIQGAKVTCYCGKSERPTKCSEDRPAFQCGKKCEKILNCNKHKCEKNCHQGECLPCKKKKLVKCHCGKNEEVIGCAQTSYGCEQTCNKLLDCGYHHCEKDCHEGSCGTCQKTPQLQKTCPCGRYELMFISELQRLSCKDPIPSCGMPCKKVLNCGHQCPLMCHEGKCPQCKIIVNQKCRCSTIERKIQCFKSHASKDEFKCTTLCKKRRACGQHNCNTECCKFRNSPFPEDHPCELTCQRKLNCEKHTCDMPCHAGLCKKCPVIYSQPQPCPCGATSTKPPIVCGTITPECENVCNKKMDCGHNCRQLCHYGQCRCYEQVQVQCRCGREKIKTTCGRQTLCLNKCQRELPCGHKCLIQCHPGDCSGWYKGPSCSKKCDRIRQDCGHRCKMICHPNKRCDEFTCEAEILIKCECGHRQKQVLCQSKGLNEKGNRVVKHIVCNQKCENLKRFDFFYKGKQIYYPNALMQFGFKNWNYLQKVEDRLKRFILESEENFIEIEFKLDNTARIALLNLFESHYHLNAHFYRHMKSSSFTLMQTQNTMVPNPILSQYIKKVSKGEIKRTNLPFEYTIKFDFEPKQRTDGVLRNLKSCYLHKFYIQRKDKIIHVHFWSKEEGLSAQQVLENMFITIDFRGEQNYIEREDENLQEIEIEEIVEQEAPKFQVQNTQNNDQMINREETVEKPTKDKQVQKLSEIKETEERVDTKQAKEEDSEQKKQEKPTEEKPKIIVTTKTVKKSPPIIVRPPNPFMIPKEYPAASEFVQDIYEVDADQLFGEKVNWDELIEKFLQKKLGPEASEWRIRTLLMISLFHPVSEQIFKDQFERIHKIYEKDKSRAARILEIQKIDYRKVQEQMAENHIYLSDHQPEILSYCILKDYLALDKVEIAPTNECSETRQIQRVLEVISELEATDYKELYNSFLSADYLFACAMKPFISEMRERTVKKFANTNKLEAQKTWEYLLFDDEEDFIQFLKECGLKVYKKVSKSDKVEYYRLKEESKLVEKIPIDLNEKSIIKKIQEKRNKKYFISEPEQLVNNEWMTRSFFAFGDFRQNTTKNYAHAMAKKLKNID